MSEEIIQPKWHKEILSFKGIMSTFIIEGNVYDKYPYFNERRGKYLFYNLNDLLFNFFNAGSTENSYDFLFYDPSLGFFDPMNKKVEMTDRLGKKRNVLKQIKEGLSGLNENRAEPNDQMVKDSEVIRTAMTTPPESDEDRKYSTAIVLNFASRFVSSPDNLSENEMLFFLNLQYASNNAKLGNGKQKNTLILIVDKFNDIPAWFYMNNPNVRQVSVPNPDRETRKTAIDKYYEEKDFGSNEGKEKYIDLTDKMKIIEIEALKRLLDNERDNISDISDVISIYKYGFKDNKWIQIRRKLRDMDISKEIHKRIKGQDKAIEKAVQIIKRSVVGISGLQHSSNTKPKGILFLVGPTGTGKTELVKAITKLLFEDERALVRFDMSEYGEENSDQKLFGAPPGYVGYGQGGQLTNAIRANPFSILLFDEIEKAHPTIMDKFLQILEDGRMTDGQGNTVYFSETLIFFTSNKGISEEIRDPSGKIIGRESIVKLGDSYETIQSRVSEALKLHFKPEVLGRIGENNVIVFDYISPEVAEKIVESNLERINKNIEKEQKITIKITDEGKAWFYKKCKEEKYRESGGRGVGNAIEEFYLNRLGDFLFENYCKENAKILVSVREDEILFSLQ